MKKTIAGVVAAAALLTAPAAFADGKPTSPGRSGAAPGAVVATLAVGDGGLIATLASGDGGLIANLYGTGGPSASLAAGPGGLIAT
jgi:hypothetical protein